jgi:hypothetical protein
MATKQQQPAALEVGDRVLIIGKSHPARGEIGVVTVAPRPLRLFGALPEKIWLEVEILGWAGHECGAQPDDVKRIAGARE